MKRKENAPTISGRLSPATSTVTTVTAPGETDSVGNVTSTLAHTSLGTVLLNLCVCVCVSALCLDAVTRFLSVLSL